MYSFENTENYNNDKNLLNIPAVSYIEDTNKVHFKRTDNLVTMPDLIVDSKNEYNNFIGVGNTGAVNCGIQPIVNSNPLKVSNSCLLFLRVHSGNRWINLSVPFDVRRICVLDLADESGYDKTNDKDILIELNKKCSDEFQNYLKEYIENNKIKNNFSLNTLLSSYKKDEDNKIARSRVIEHYNGSNGTTSSYYLYKFPESNVAELEGATTIGGLWQKISAKTDGSEVILGKDNIGDFMFPGSTRSYDGWTEKFIVLEGTNNTFRSAEEVEENLKNRLDQLTDTNVVFLGNSSLQEVTADITEEMIIKVVDHLEGNFVDYEGESPLHIGPTDCAFVMKKKETEEEISQLSLNNIDRETIHPTIDTLTLNKPK